MVVMDIDTGLVFEYFFTVGAAVGTGLMTGGGIIYLAYKLAYNFISRKRSEES